MWSHEFSADTDATPEAVWAVLRDLHTGAVPDGSGDMFEIHGRFAAGTEVSGGTRVTHRLEIDGPAAETVAPGLGRQITEDFPATMASLLSRASGR